MKLPIIYGLILSGLMLPSFASAEDVSMQPKKVALFKNGYGYLTLEGKTGSEASMNLSNLPVPSFGTFWLDVERPAQVKRLASSKVKKQIPAAHYTLENMIEANPGCPVQVVTPEGMLSGTIVARPIVKEQNPNLIGGDVPPMLSVYGVPMRADKVPVASESSLFLSTEGRTISIPMAQVKRVEFMRTQALPTVETWVPSVSLDLEAPQQGKTITATCIAGGIAWVPGYKVDLRDDGKAVFTAQATVINELMDFDKVDMDLITGFPNLKYAGVPSPIAMQQTLSQFMAALYGAENGMTPQPMAMLNMQVEDGLATGSLRSGTGAISGFKMPSQVTQSEDLFFYPVKDFSCKLNETVTTPLFSGEVPYSHIYTWDIPDQRTLENEARRGAYNPNEDNPAKDVWHCIRLKNEFKLPLTTGVVEFTANGNISGQAMIQFTAPGQDATVKINKTMEMAVNQSENVLETTPVPKSSDKISLVEGTLVLKNVSGKAMEVEVTKQIVGTPKSATEGGSFTQRPNHFYGGNNPAGTFTWTVNVPAGETKTVQYRYNYED